jgi:hypothetical protein
MWKLFHKDEVVFGAGVADFPSYSTSCLCRFDFRYYFDPGPRQLSEGFQRLSRLPYRWKQHLISVEATLTYKFDLQ